jgi:hypothetical protein
VSAGWRDSDLAELALQVLQVMTALPQTHTLMASSTSVIGPEPDVNVNQR